MAAFDLEEQEQISQIKGWWEQYGTLVTGIAVAAAVAAVGWQGWHWYQGKQTAEASALYVALERAAGAGEPQKAREAAGQLIDKYSGTPYADLGALISAKLQFEAGDAKSARAQLEWAAANANDPTLRDLARLRLAAVQFDDKAFDDALKTLDKAPAEAALLPRFADLRGDVLQAHGKSKEARAAYQAGIAALPADAAQAGSLRDILQAKLDSLGDAS